jgi:hypothetical protein
VIGRSSSGQGLTRPELAEERRIRDRDAQINRRRELGEGVVFVGAIIRIGRRAAHAAELEDVLGARIAGMMVSNRKAAPPTAARAKSYSEGRKLDAADDFAVGDEAVPIACRAAIDGGVIVSVSKDAASMPPAICHCCCGFMV